MKPLLIGDNMESLKPENKLIEQEVYEKRMQGLIQKEDYPADIKIDNTFGSYRLKLASNLEEMCEAFQLRYEVFFDQKQNPSLNAALDSDEFDLIADHLILIDTNENKVIGTYRIIDSTKTESFYSEGEFNLAPLRGLEGKCLELGRACIHPDYRTGTSIALIWQGIGEYMKQSQAQWAFGCSSIPMDEIDQMHKIGARLIRDHLVDEKYLIEPKKPFVHEKLSFKKELKGNFSSLAEDMKVKIPPLLKGYLKLGAKICGAPSWDEEFKTLDFFTLLSIEDMNPQFLKRFGVR